MIAFDARCARSQRPSAALAELNNGRFNKASLIVAEIDSIAEHDACFESFALFVALDKPVADGRFASINCWSLRAVKTSTVGAPRDVPRRQVC